MKTAIKFNYLSSFLSTGKTEANINEALEIVKDATGQGLNVVICSPTKQHSSEIKKRTIDKVPTANVIIINEDFTKTPVLDLDAYFNNSSITRTILLVTHNAFALAQKRFNRDKWVVFYDEKLSVNDFQEVELTRFREAATKYLTIKQPDKETSVLKVKKKYLKELGEMIEEGSRDKLLKQLIPEYTMMVKSILGEVELIVNVADYKAFVEGKRNTGSIFIWTTPKMFEGFHRVVFTSAFLDSLLWKQIWELKYKVEWVIAEEHKKHLREIGTRPIKILYFLDDVQWSMRLQDEKRLDGKPITEFMLNQITKHFNDQKMLGLMNKKYIPLIKQHQNIIECPQNAAGLDCYKDIPVAFSLKAMNAKPQEYQFYRYFDLVDNMKFHELEQTLQAFFRSKARDYENQHPITFVVVSSLLANNIKKLLDNYGFDTTLEQFPMDEKDAKALGNAVVDCREFNTGRPRKYKMAPEKLRNLKQKQRRLKKELDEIDIKIMTKQATPPEIKRYKALSETLEQIGKTLVADMIK